jgi:hypothetical protein
MKKRKLSIILGFVVLVTALELTMTLGVKCGSESWETI